MSARQVLYYLAIPCPLKQACTYVGDVSVCTYMFMYVCVPEVNLWYCWFREAVAHPVRGTEVPVPTEKDKDNRNETSHEGCLLKGGDRNQIPKFDSESEWILLMTFCHLWR